MRVQEFLKLCVGDTVERVTVTAYADGTRQETAIDVFEVERVEDGRTPTQVVDHDLRLFAHLRSYSEGWVTLDLIRAIVRTDRDVTNRPGVVLEATEWRLA